PRCREILYHSLEDVQGAFISQIGLTGLLHPVVQFTEGGQIKTDVGAVDGGIREVRCQLLMNLQPLLKGLPGFVELVEAAECLPQFTIARGNVQPCERRQTAPILLSTGGVKPLQSRYGLAVVVGRRAQLAEHYKPLAHVFVGLREVTNALCTGAKVPESF